MKYLSFLLLLLLLTACPKHEKYKTCDIPDYPVNLWDFNSEFDDYNSSSPVDGSIWPLCFSTNRNSGGNDFDVIFRPLNINFDKTSGVLTVQNNYEIRNYAEEEYEKIPEAISRIRTTGNELGPNLLIEGGKAYTLAYATDSAGDFDIMFTSDKSDPGFSEPVAIKYLNSSYDDLYPSPNQEWSRIYFCSDRENGNFDIYYAEVGKSYNSYEEMFSDTLVPHNILKDTVLSGSSNDKCPFVWYKYLVFTSDRPGGYGGFDLYYSVYEDGEWSDPVNFGDKINSPYDEYRPILVMDGLSWTETMMIFSSNRPGGKGGFDLYFVGVPLMKNF